MLITAWRIIRVGFDLLSLTIGYLSLAAGKRQLDQWRTGSAQLDNIVRTASSVAEASPTAIDRDYEGRLIHLVGPLSVTAAVDSCGGLRPSPARRPCNAWA